MSDARTWVPHTPAPVGFGAWDSREVGRAGLVRMGDSLWSFFSGCDQRFEWKIGVALSPDGITWDRLCDEPLIVPPGTRAAGGGYHGYLDPCPRVLPDGTLELLFSAMGGGPGATILGARSVDAVDWSAPRVELASPGWDGEALVVLSSPWIAEPPGVGPDGAAMFVTRGQVRGDGARASAIARYDRVDGSWQDRAPRLADPDGHEVDHPCVVVGPDGWRLWCTSARPTSWRILTARSDDGLDWSPLEPVLEGDPRSPHQTAGVYAPAVVAGPDGLLMLHLACSRTSDGMSVVTFAARSADGRRWEPLSDRPVFTPRPGLPVRPW